MRPASKKATKRKPRNLMEAVLMADPGPPLVHYKVWVLLRDNDAPYLTTVAWSRKEATSIPHERGVRVSRATLTIPSPPRKRPT